MTLALNALRGVYIGVRTEPDIHQTQDYALAAVHAYEALIGRTVAVPQFNIPFTDDFDAKLLQAIHDDNKIPFATWKCQSGDGNQYTLKKVLDGVHDAYIRSQAQTIAAFGHRFPIRIFHEMNIGADGPGAGSWNIGQADVNGHMVTPTDFKQAFRHVRKLLNDEGAHNAELVWCPTCWSDDKSKWNATNSSWDPTLSKNDCYPGPTPVAYIGLDNYNWGSKDGTPTGNWREFIELFQPSYDRIVAKHPHKPIVVAEYGCDNEDLFYNPPSSGKGGWFGTAHTDVLQMEKIRMLGYFDYNGDTGLYGPTPNHWNIDSEPGSASGFAASVDSPDFIDQRTGETEPHFLRMRVWADQTKTGVEHQVLIVTGARGAENLNTPGQYQFQAIVTDPDTAYLQKGAWCELWVGFDSDRQELWASGRLNHHTKQPGSQWLHDIYIDDPMIDLAYYRAADAQKMDFPRYCRKGQGIMTVLNGLVDHSPVGFVRHRKTGCSASATSIGGGRYRVDVSIPADANLPIVGKAITLKSFSNTAYNGVHQLTAVAQILGPGTIIASYVRGSNPGGGGTGGIASWQVSGRGKARRGQTPNHFGALPGWAHARYVNGWQHTPARTDTGTGTIHTDGTGFDVASVDFFETTTQSGNGVAWTDNTGGAVKEVGFKTDFLFAPTVTVTGVTGTVVTTTEGFTITIASGAPFKLVSFHWSAVGRTANPFSSIPDVTVTIGTAAVTAVTKTGFSVTVSGATHNHDYPFTWSAHRPAHGGGPPGVGTSWFVAFDSAKASLDQVAAHFACHFRTALQRVGNMIEIDFGLLGDRSGMHIYGGDAVQEVTAATQTGIAVVTMDAHGYGSRWVSFDTAFVRGAEVTVRAIDSADRGTVFAEAGDSTGFRLRINRGPKNAKIRVRWSALPWSHRDQQWPEAIEAQNHGLIVGTPTYTETADRVINIYPAVGSGASGGNKLNLKILWPGRPDRIGTSYKPRADGRTYYLGPNTYHWTGETIRLAAWQRNDGTWEFGVLSEDSIGRYGPREGFLSLSKIEDVPALLEAVSAELIQTADPPPSWSFDTIHPGIKHHGIPKRVRVGQRISAHYRGTAQPVDMDGNPRGEVTYLDYDADMQAYLARGAVIQWRKLQTVQSVNWSWTPGTGYAATYVLGEGRKNTGFKGWMTRVGRRLERHDTSPARVRRFGTLGWFDGIKFLLSKGAIEKDHRLTLAPGEMSISDPGDLSFFRGHRRVKFTVDIPDHKAHMDFWFSRPEFCDPNDWKDVSALPNDPNHGEWPWYGVLRIAMRGSGFHSGFFTTANGTDFTRHVLFPDQTSEWGFWQPHKGPWVVDVGWDGSQYTAAVTALGAKRIDGKHPTVTRTWTDKKSEWQNHGGIGWHLGGGRSSAAVYDVQINPIHTGDTHKQHHTGGNH